MSDQVYHKNVFNLCNANV